MRLTRTPIFTDKRPTGAMTPDDDLTVPPWEVDEKTEQFYQETMIVIYVTFGLLVLASLISVCLYI